MAIQILTIFAQTGLAILFLILWGISVVYVFIDSSRRNLPAGSQMAWLAAAGLLPLLGVALYAANRRLAQFAGQRGWGRQPEDLPRASTLPRPVDRPMQVPEPGGAPGTIAAPLSHSPPGRAGGSEAAGQGSTDPVEVFPAGSLPSWQPAPASRSYTLQIVEGPYAGQELPLPPLPAQIGRGTNSGVRLDVDAGVSRQHAEIYVQEGALRVRDLGSTHGTYLNGYRILDMSLQPGDRLQIGGTVFYLRS